MKKSAFVARTDIEVGDKVRYRYFKTPNMFFEGTGIVYDIRTIHYYRTLNVEFEFLIADESMDITIDWLKREDFERIL